MAKVSTETLRGIGSILCVLLCAFMFQDGEDLLEAKLCAWIRVTELGLEKAGIGMFIMFFNNELGTKK